MFEFTRQRSGLIACSVVSSISNITIIPILEQNSCIIIDYNIVTNNNQNQNFKTGKIGFQLKQNSMSNETILQNCLRSFDNDDI